LSSGRNGTLIFSKQRVSTLAIAMAEKITQSLNEPSDALAHRRLSDREFEVFHQLVSRKAIAEIGQDMCLSVKTVSTL
jgi:DNA-binding NarL/FixJ family response regulator